MPVNYFFFPEVPFDPFIKVLLGASGIIVISIREHNIMESRRRNFE